MWVVEGRVSRVGRGGRVRCIRFFDRTGGGGGEEVNTERKSGDF